MEIINFKKSGDPIKFKFVVKEEGLSVVYSIELFKKNGKRPILTYLGDNHNCRQNEKHEHYLPVPLNENDKRLICINADYMGYGNDIKRDYLFSFEVYQGKELLKTIEKKGCLSATEESISILAQLSMN